MYDSCMCLDIRGVYPYARARYINAYVRARVCVYVQASVLGVRRREEDEVTAEYLSDREEEQVPEPEPEAEPEPHDEREGDEHECYEDMPEGDELPAVQVALETFQHKWLPVKSGGDIIRNNLADRLDRDFGSDYAVLTTELYRDYPSSSKLRVARRQRYGDDFPTNPHHLQGWLEFTATMSVLNDIEYTCGGTSRDVDRRLQDIHEELTNDIEKLAEIVEYNDSQLPNIQGFEFIHGGVMNLPYVSKVAFEGACEDLSHLDLKLEDAHITWSICDKGLIQSPERSANAHFTTLAGLWNNLYVEHIKQ